MFRWEEESSMLISMEPGDATRYEFMVMPIGPGRVCVAGQPKFGMYDYELESIFAAHTRLGDMPIGEEEPLSDHYVKYVVEHSKCNPHTARAMIHGVAMAYLEVSGVIDHNDVSLAIRKH